VPCRLTVAAAIASAASHRMLLIAFSISALMGLPPHSPSPGSGSSREAPLPSPGKREPGEWKRVGAAQIHFSKNLTRLCSKLLRSATVQERGSHHLLQQSSRVILVASGPRRRLTAWRGEWLKSEGAQ
jgi:hypothetical protein